MSFKLVNVSHRHYVFTIDQNLRDFFLKDRSLLNCLFHAVNSVVSQWRTAILISFGYDPLKCDKCKHEMKVLEIYYNHKRVSPEELYEKAMSKSRGKRSSA